MDGKEVGNFKFEVYADGSEVTIRTGEALEIKPPVSVNASTDICGPLVFAKEKIGEANRAITTVYMCARAGEIRLVHKDNDFYQDEIKGNVVKNQELNKFCINTNKLFNMMEMKKLIRFSKLYMTNEQYDKILDSLEKFSAKQETALKNIDDRRGNSEYSVVKQLTTDIEMSFVLDLPIYQNMSNKTFRVDILCDVTDGGIKFWLESVELYNLEKSIIEDEFERQADEFKMLGITVLFEN